MIFFRPCSATFLDSCESSGAACPVTAARSRATLSLSRVERFWMEYLPGYAPELNRWSISGPIGNSTRCHCLSKRLLGAGGDRASGSEADATPSAAECSLLAAGRTVLWMSLYYAKYYADIK